MKRCPSCNRTYTDITLSFCLDDGTPLLAVTNAPSSFDSNAPTLYSSSRGADPPPTEIYHPNAPTINQVAPPPAWSPPAPAQPVRKKSRAWLWIIGGLAVLSVFGVGFIILIIALASIDSQPGTNQANANSSSGNSNRPVSSPTPVQQNSSNVKGAGQTANVSTAKGLYIASINMADDDGNGQPGDTATSFNPSDKIVHCVVTMKEALPGTKLKFRWYAVNAKGLPKNQAFKDVDYTTGASEKVVHAQLTTKQDWPTGDYKVEVYVNGALDRTIEYSVEAE